MSKYKPKGLQNFQFNCYMNSLIQCLFYCREFREKLLNSHVDQSQTLLLLLKGIFKELNNPDKNELMAKKIKNYFNNYDLFNDKPADITDLLDYIFSTIYYENKKEDSVRSTNRGEIYNDKSASFKEIENDIDFKLIINEFFLGFYECDFECKKGHHRYSFQNEYRMAFPLEEISEYYKTKNKQNITLNECFEYYQLVKYNLSEKCSCGKKFALKEKIFMLPKILIIILDRGRNKKYNKIVEFPEEIDLKNLIDKDKQKDQANLFKLIGVSSHIGNPGLSGHYISFCLCDDNNFYRFSDSHVRKIDNIKNLYEGSSYVLFYKKIDKEMKSKNNEKIQITAINKNENQFNNLFSSYINSFNDINKLMIENINSIINKHGFVLNGENKLFWENKRDNNSVTINIISKIIQIILYKNIDKNDKSKSFNNQYIFNINLDKNINSLNNLIYDFENKFKMFFKY